MNYTIQEPIFGNYIIKNIRTNSNIFTRDQTYLKEFTREQENSKIPTREQKYLKVFLHNQSMTTVETIVSSTNNNNNTSGDISKNPLAYSLLQALVIVIFIYLITIATCCIAIQRYKKRLYKNHPNISYDAQYNNNSGCC